MSNNFRDLHSYVSQRLLSLFETLAKKYHKLEKELLSKEQNSRIKIKCPDMKSKTFISSVHTSQEAESTLDNHLSSQPVNDEKLEMANTTITHELNPNDKPDVEINVNNLTELEMKSNAGDTTINVEDDDTTTTLVRIIFFLLSKSAFSKKSHFDLLYLRLLISQVQDINVLEEVLRMILEIINSCLSNQLQHNPNLIYALLYKKKIFDPFRNHQNFQDIIQNLDAVINYFSDKLKQVQSDLSVNEVLSTITQGTLVWPSHKLKVICCSKYY